MQITPQQYVKTYHPNFKQARFGVRADKYEIKSLSPELVKITGEPIPELHYLGRGIFRSAAPDLTKPEVIDTLAKLRIGTIVDLRGDSAPRELVLPGNSSEKRIRMIGFDASANGVTTKLDRARLFVPELEKIISTVGRKSRLLIHCDKGISRTSQVVAFVRRLKGYTKTEALDDTLATVGENQKGVVNTVLNIYDSATREK